MTGRSFDERQLLARQQIAAKPAVTKAKFAEEEAAFEALISGESPHQGGFVVSCRPQTGAP
jgi:hypothetical protein